MDISVVIPLYNEEESLPELFAWIQRVMDANRFSYEVIFVNDGSTDHSWQVIEKLRSESDNDNPCCFHNEIPPVLLYFANPIPLRSLT